MLLKFSSISRPVQLVQGLKVLPHLVRVFAKWPFREIPAAGAGDPLINVVQVGDGYVLEAPWTDQGQRYDDAAALADGLSWHITRSWMEEQPELVAIQAAAVLFGNDLVVFIGGPRSGKSLLVSCLAAAGHTAFADAILPVSAELRSGASLGIAPRVKLPLPDALGEPLRSLVVAQTDSGAAHLGYLKPRRTQLAPLGEAVPIRAFVLLDRTDGKPASLRPAAASTVLKRLLLGSFDTLPSTNATLELIHEMVTDTHCYRLSWSDPQEAVNALRARLAIWRPQESEDDSRDSKPVKARRRRAQGPRVPSGRRFRHVQGLDERQVDSDLFLVDPQGEAIYHLNGLGAGLWRLLDGSWGMDDAVSLLRQAYPTVDCKALESDVERLIEDLTDRGLVVEQKSA